MKHSLLLGSFCLLAAACAAPSDPVDGTATADVVTSPGVVTSISPNAKPGAKYLKVRSYDALKLADGVSQLQQKIIDRIKAYYSSASFQLGTAALLFAEAPERWSTFLPAEQAAFPSLWALLELPTDPDTVDPLLQPLDGATKLVRPDATRYDETQRVRVSALPPYLQEIALRVVNAPGTNANTVSYAEVTKAIAEYAHYIPTEYERFGPLLHAVEALSIDPTTFPRIEILRPLDATNAVTIGSNKLIATRKSNKTCNAGATISASSTIVFQTGYGLTWTPINESGRLFDVYNREVENPGPSTNYHLGSGRSIALVESWSNGQRTGQAVVVMGGSETVSLDSAAIVERGTFACTPYQSQWGDVREPLTDVLRLPAGRYPVPLANGAIAHLDVYGLGVMRFDSVGAIAWTTDPAPTAGSDPSACFAMNTGVGADFRLDYKTSQIRMGNLSCASAFAAGGTTGVSLEASDRL